MSFIAKMNLVALRLFSDGNVLANIQCVYDQDLGQPENEDVRFTKASPWGEGSLTIERGPDVPPQGSQLYLTFDEDQPETFENCLFALPVFIAEVFETPHSRKGTFRPQWSGDPLAKIPPAKRIAKETLHFELSMSVDNPGAYEQLRAGATFWLQFFDASKVSMAEAIHNLRRERPEEARD